MRIIDKLVEYIEANTDYEITDVDSFYSEDSERLMLRQDAATLTNARYFDGSRIGSFAYSIYAKSMDPQSAVAQLFDIEQLLDIPHGLLLEEGLEVVHNEVLVPARFVTKTDKNEKIYTSDFLLDYYMEAK